MLSEEQAIENLKKIREDTIKANKCGLSNNDFKEEIEIYDIVLNTMTKLQKENKDIKSRKEHQERRFKKYKENIEKQHEEIYENLVSEKEKYVYLYQKALNNTIKSDRENIQLKKQIDLMAEVMFKSNKAQLLIEYGIENKEQIIKEFEKLVKEKGE